MTLDLKSKFAELEARRRFHIDGVDAAVEGMAVLRDLDRHLVEQGFHEALQLEYAVSEDPPVGELPEFQDAPEAPPATVEAAPMPAANSKPRGATSRRYTDMERTEAVRLADELGSDNAAGKQLQISGVSIGNWRRAGIGKKPKLVAAKAETHGRQPPAHDGPQIKCSICRAMCPIAGEVNEVSKVTALREHYKDSAECQDALRRRRG